MRYCVKHSYAYTATEPVDTGEQLHEGGIFTNDTAEGK